MVPIKITITPKSATLLLPQQNLKPKIDKTIKMITQVIVYPAHIKTELYKNFTAIELPHLHHMGDIAVELYQCSLILQA